VNLHLPELLEDIKVLFKRKLVSKGSS